MRSFSLVFLGIGFLFLAIAIGVFLFGSWFRIQAEKVDGIVTDVVLRPYADGNAYCPVIKYSVLGGATYTHNSDLCSWPASYEQGQHVTLYVDRIDPERVQLNDFFSIWFFPLLFGFIGLIFAGVGYWASRSNFGYSLPTTRNQ
jgi:hypothetical protein